MTPLGHGVVTAGMEGMATQDSARPQPHPAPETVPNEGLLDKMRAGGLEATAWSDERREDQPVETKDPPPGGAVLARARAVVIMHARGPSYLSVEPEPSGSRTARPGPSPAPDAGVSPRSLLNRSSSSSIPSAAPDFLAITTTSRPGSSSLRRRRNHSRTRRLNRFRRTAFPTLRLAVIPSRRESAPRSGARRPSLLAFSSIPLARKPLRQLTTTRSG